MTLNVECQRVVTAAFREIRTHSAHPKHRSASDATQLPSVKPAVCSDDDHARVPGLFSLGVLRAEHRARLDGNTEYRQRSGKIGLNQDPNRAAVSYTHLTL